MKKTILLLLVALSVSSAFGQNLQPWEGSVPLLFTAITKSGNTGYIAKSSNGGHNWNIVWDAEMEAKSSSNRLFGITSGNGIVVAVGNTIVSSSDKGKTWSETHLFTNANEQAFSRKNPMTCVTYGDGLFVAAGPFNVVFSSDGKNWRFYDPNQVQGTDRPDGRTDKALKTPLDIQFIDGEFFVVGGNLGMEGTVFKKKDGGLIKVRNIEFEGNGANLNTGGLKRLAHDGKNTLVAVSNSTKSAYSTDKGQTWKYIFNPGKNQGWAATFANGKWLAASPFEDIFHSDDITAGWQSVKRDGGRGHVNDMIYSYDRFIMVGNRSLVLGSADGIEWSKLGSAGEFGMNCMDITALETN